MVYDNSAVKPVLLEQGPATLNMVEVPEFFRLFDREALLEELLDDPD